MGWLYLAAAALEAALAQWGPWKLPWSQLVYTDYILLGLAGLHAAFGVASLAVPRRRRGPFLQLHLSELAFTVSLVLFLFAWIFALNANMSYVQRFFAGGGKMRLALDTRAERLAAAVRYLPFLAADAAAYLWGRLGGTRRLRRADPASSRGGRPLQPGPWPARWALPLVLLSVALSVLSFPSFAWLNGLGFLCFAALIPLFLVVENASLVSGWLHVITYGILEGMLISFWLGTFSLVTLQLVTVFYLLAYAVFFLPALWVCRRLSSLRFLALALAWVLFEYVRSLGYWGYPWGLWGTAPYLFLSLVQTASLAGVWGVSFVVVALNAGAAAALSAALRRADPWPGARAAMGAALLLAVCILFGVERQDRIAAQPIEKTARVALIQQDSDPRKDDYAQTFATLRRLTDQALAVRPRAGLVVWSETAFVPNIRRWSKEDPAKYPLARLVREFLDYDRGLHVWLLTGNDDYSLTTGPSGEEERLDYNAAVLFNAKGQRVQTYHKMHLVPFTEYFPFKSQLPGVYRWLTNFDVYLWEPGRERVIFRYPLFTFFTPICFEDSFPDDIRRFVLEGADAIVNISNDYWSLTEVEGKQHAVNSSFRAVENARPLLRSTASGLTGYFDVDGSLLASVPYYQERYLVVDVAFRPDELTFYTRHGDWLPQAAAVLLALLALASLFPRLRKRM